MSLRAEKKNTDPIKGGIKQNFESGGIDHEQVLKIGCMCSPLHLLLWSCFVCLFFILCSVIKNVFLWRWRFMHNLESLWLLCRCCFFNDSQKRACSLPFYSASCFQLTEDSWFDWGQKDPFCSCLFLFMSFCFCPFTLFCLCVCRFPRVGEQ